MATIKETKWPWPINQQGDVGITAEEMKVLGRRMEKNPAASPMPELAPIKFLDPKKSSDNLRMGEPKVPLTAIDTVQTTLTHVILRRVLSKARRRGAVLFDEAVEEEELAGLDRNRRAQMRAALMRERRLLELLDKYNGMAEDVYMRLLAGAKG